MDDIEQQNQVFRKSFTGMLIPLNFRFFSQILDILILRTFLFLFMLGHRGLKFSPFRPTQKSV